MRDTLLFEDHHSEMGSPIPRPQLLLFMCIPKQQHMKEPGKEVKMRYKRETGIFGFKTKS